jgi:WhiB family transcriptional regulator, redox-sensing transcriptional regulator
MTAWWDLALCREIGHPDLFFFPDPKGSMRPGKTVCARCPVRRDCLDDALTWEQTHLIWGIRGGLSANERSAILTRRRQGAA